MDSFIETPRLPDTISYGSSGGPSFKTFVFTGDSGRDGLVQGWERVKARYDVQYAIRDIVDLRAVVNMFYNCRGKAVGFRFKDHSDFVATDEPCIGLVNGVNTTFRLQKRYTSGALSFDRRIFKPVAGTLSVEKNGSGIGFTSFNTTTGVFTLSSAPIISDVITASFQFDVPVRFDTDEMMVSRENHELLTWDSIPLVEIILED